MILMIDNYDSFVYNLVQYLNALGEEVKVVRNDALDIEGIRRMAPSMVVISPGPCTPSEAGISLQVVAELAGEIPILGICLGHQTIAQSLGAKVVRGNEPVHGKVYPVWHDGKGLFEGIKNPVNVTRYHSLVVDESTLPDSIEVSARTEDGVIMAMRHRTLLMESVQFHPEAILTESGMEMLQGFLKQAVVFWQSRRNHVSS